MRSALDNLLFPRSIAVVGASPRRPEVVKNVLRGSAASFGVSPSRDEVLGLPCFPSIRSLPEPPELAILLVNHRIVGDAFEEAASAGVRAFILPGLGNEAGAEAREVAGRIAARARELGAVLLGPNCMGVASPGRSSPWLGTLRGTVCSGHVAAVVQSGLIGESLLALGPRIGFRSVVSSGSEAVTDVADLVAYFADDKGTKAVGLFLESVRRPTAFADALGRCADAGKPVVCLKVGRSAVAARLALGHTGAIVGSSRAFSALLWSYGTIEVDDFPDLVETLETLGRRRRPHGTRLGVVTESGGEGALLADHADMVGLRLEPLPIAVARQLQDEFPNFVNPGNPLDVWAIDAVERVYPRSLELMARSGCYDILVAHLGLSQFRGEWEQEWCRLIVSALAEAVQDTAVFPAITTALTGDPPADTQALARGLDLALLRGPGCAMRSLAAVARWRPRRPPTPAACSARVLDAPFLGEGPLPEFESSLLLESYGVAFAAHRRVGSPQEAARVAAELGPPVVVKLDGPKKHRLRGAVALGIETPDAAAEAARRLGGHVIVAKQLPPGREVFCGMTRDTHYGPVLAVGLGGAGVEERGAIAVALAPLDLPAAQELVAEAGLETTVNGIAETLVALGQLSVEHECVAEVDVNPLIVGETGAIAVDALVVMRPSAGG